jgi:hypothetical protein
MSEGKKIQLSINGEVIGNAEPSSFESIPYVEPFNSNDEITAEHNRNMVKDAIYETGGSLNVTPFILSRMFIKPSNIIHEESFYHEAAIKWGNENGLKFEVVKPGELFMFSKQ